MTTYQEAQEALYLDILALAEARGLPLSPSVDALLAELDASGALLTLEAASFCSLYHEADEDRRNMGADAYFEAVSQARATVQARIDHAA